MLSILTRWRPPMLMQCSRKHKTDFFLLHHHSFSLISPGLFGSSKKCVFSSSNSILHCWLLSVLHFISISVALLARVHTFGAFQFWKVLSDWWTLSSHHKRVRLHYLFMMSMMDEISAFLNVPSSSLPACLQLQHDLRPQHISLLHCWFRSFSVIIFIFHVFCIHFETQRQQSLLAVSCWACIDIIKEKRRPIVVRWLHWRLFSPYSNSSQLSAWCVTRLCFLIENLHYTFLILHCNKQESSCSSTCKFILKCN